MIAITKHAKDKAKQRFGFTASDLKAIVEKGDKLSDREKELIWNSRPANKILTKKATEHFFDYESAAVVITSPVPDGLVVITVFEAKYIKVAREKYQPLPPPPRYWHEKKEETLISRKKADEIWEKHRKGAKVFVKGQEKELFVEDTGVVGFYRSDSKFLPLCNFAARFVRVQEG